MQIKNWKSKGTAKFARPIALALCVVLSLSASAKADSLAYLNAMLADPVPDVLVDPYSFSQTGMDVSVTGQLDITAPDQSTITIDDGADTGGPYMGIFSASITLDAGNNPTGGTLSQSVYLSGLGGSPTLMFSSSDLLPLAFGAVTGHAGISYWFAFTQDTSTFYAPAGDVIGGLLTTEGDLKEFAFPVPLPGAAQGGLALLLGLAICMRFRREQSNLTPLS